MTKQVETSLSNSRDKQSRKLELIKEDLQHNLKLELQTA